jgi:signal transduction histidine kinase
MSLKSRLLLALLLIGTVPVLLLSTLTYWHNIDKADNLLRDRLNNEVSLIRASLEMDLDKNEKSLIKLIENETLNSFLSEIDQDKREGTEIESQIRSVNSSLPDSVRLNIEDFLRYQPYYGSLSCFDLNRRLLFHVESMLRPNRNIEIRFSDSIPPDLYVEDSIWTEAAKGLVVSPAIIDTTGARRLYTIPVYDKEKRLKAVVRADLRLDKLFDENVKSIFNEVVYTNSPVSRSLIIVDRSERIAFHTNDALKYQTVSNVIPFFKEVVASMAKSGAQTYQTPDGRRWLAVYQPIEKLNLSIASTIDYTSAAQRPEWPVLVSIIISLIGSILAIGLLFKYIRPRLLLAENRESIKIDAIKENEGQSLELSKYRAKPSSRAGYIGLNAEDSFEREIEARQFELFMRLSSMLAYDLQKTITTLSRLIKEIDTNKEIDKETFTSPLKRTINDLQCVVSKLSEPQKTISGEHSCPTDLVPIIREVVDSLLPSRDDLYQIEVDLPNSLIVNIDAEKIRRVAEHIFINALEAIGAKGGRIKILAGEYNKEELFFSIADSGPGISEEFLRKRLFHPFVSTKNRGIGLGLYTCQEIVKFYGGRIEVESGTGKETCFRVILPRRK